MIEFAFGLCLGAVLAVIVYTALLARQDVDEYRRYLDGLRRMQAPYDWKELGDL